MLILDEADRMLDLGFAAQLNMINKAADHRKRQTMLFSATFPKDIQALANQWTYVPKEVSVVPLETTNKNIDQVIYTVEADQKWDVLHQLLLEKPGERTIIFANRRDETRDLYERLKEVNINCAMLSGEVAQDKRVKTLNGFKNGN